MPIETATVAADLNDTYPLGSDPKYEGDNHVRLVKTVLKAEASIARSSLSSLSTGLSTVTSTATAVSTSLGNVSTSLGNVSTSQSAISASQSAISTSLTGVSTSLGNVSTSQTSQSSILSAVSSTVAASGASAMTLVSTQTASASAQIDFTGLSSSYDYVVEISGMTPATAGADLRCRVSNFGSWVTSGSYRYAGSVVGDAGGTLSASVGSGTTFILLAQAMNNGTDGANFKVEAKGIGGGYPTILVNGSHLDNGASTMTTVSKAGMPVNGSAIDGLRFYMSAGNISAGTFKLYKIAR